MIGDIMANLNEMAGAIKTEVEQQGEKLTRLDNNMGEADKNVEKGVDQLKSARDHQKKASCCMKFLVFLICIGLIILGLVLYFYVLKK